VASKPSAAQPLAVGGIDRFGFWHNLTDLSPDDEGTWWWACTCDDAGGCHTNWNEARTGWREHLAVALAEEFTDA